MRQLHSTSIGYSLVAVLTAGLIALGGCADSVTGPTAPGGNNADKVEKAEEPIGDYRPSDNDDGSTDDPDGGHNTP